GTLRQGTPVSYCTLSSVAPAEPIILAKIVGIFIQKRRLSGGGSHKLSERLARRRRTTLCCAILRSPGDRKLQYDQNREERRYITHQRKRKCCELRAKDSTFRVTKTDKLVLKGKIKNGLFTVDNPHFIGGENQLLANVTTQRESLRENHEKFDSIPRSERASFECKSCVLAKITKQPFKEQSST
ncbi:hypothetical protein VP01_8945g1, partial [Puccinia sorghi]